MKKFMDENFLLNSGTAVTLFNATKDVPVVDYHNHLNPREIYEDLTFSNMTEVWLGGDHYKWRAMRAWGVSEDLITGDGEPYSKFLAWADTVQNLIGNPLYHWTHLELQRYFHIDTPLNKNSAKEIWDKCNALLQTKEFSVRNLLRMQNVAVLCTTDDPADTLEWHRKIKDDGFEISVLPSFRPERAMGIEKDGFREYMEKLSAASGMDIRSVRDLINALDNRLQFFTECGCRVSDHSLEGSFYRKATEADADRLFTKRIQGETLTDEEIAQYKGFLLTGLGRLYHKHDIVMQLHIGATRNNSTRFFEKIGADSGFDSLNDFNYATELCALLNEMDKTDELPRTILYCLNPKDLRMLTATAGNFCGNESGIKGKVQPGAAWWFCDHKNGIEDQIESFSDMGLIATSVGMLTDSRSFLSFPRHEYYRRILCNKIGTWVENGEYPADMEYLAGMVRGISGENAMKFFHFIITDQTIKGEQNGTES